MQADTTAPAELFTIIRASEPKGSIMTVVVYAAKREDLAGKDAQVFAKQYAISRGFSPRGLSNPPMTTPCNSDGETTDEVVKGLEPIVGYISTFQFAAGLN